jgi:hypothetical protein
VVSNLLHDLISETGSSTPLGFAQGHGATAIFSLPRRIGGKTVALTNIAI